MSRIALFAVVFASGAAAAQPKPKTPDPSLKLPVAGDTLPVTGDPGWPGLQWVYDTPSAKDAAGKIVIHWFCAPKIVGCTEDLARLTTLKESSPNVYIVAYIDGTKPQAQKLDPIRGSEGVGRGTVAYGPTVTKFFKGLGVTGALSFVVDTANKVQVITLGANPGDLDARDAKVKALASNISLHSTSLTSPTKIKPNEKFELTFSVKLASWLTFSTKPGSLYDWKATLPKDIKCDNTALKGNQLKPAGQTLLIKMTCSGPRGIYEGSAQLQFAYDTGTGASGLGADGGKWKFEIMP